MLEPKVTWVYTCMKPAFFDLTLRWLPEEPWPWLKEMKVITSYKRADLAIDLEAIRSIIRPDWPITIEHDFFAEEYARIIHPEFFEYTQNSLGVKLAIPTYIKPPFFFTDDDVIIASDPRLYIDGCNLPWGSKSGLDNIGESVRDLDDLGHFAHAFRARMPREMFNAGRTDAGVWYLPAVNVDEYSGVLKRFFAETHIPSLHGNRRRILDQRFLSMWILTHDGFPRKSPVYRAYATRALPKKVMPDSVFIHYCASSQKPRYVEWLHEELKRRDNGIGS